MAARKHGLRFGAAAAAMITMAAAATAARGQAELLINGNFEDPEDFAGWSPQVYGNCSISTEYARNEGGKSFKAFAPYSQYAGSVGIENGIAATPGNTYSLSGYMFSPTNDFIASPGDFGLLELSFRNATGGLIGNTIAAHFDNTSPKDTWVPYNVEGIAPAGTATMQVVIGYIQLSTAPVGAVWWDDLSLKQVIVNAESTWIAASSGGWLTGSNWQNGAIPNAVGAVANFNGSITAPTTVSISGAGATVGTIKFNNAANAYTLGSAAGGALTLDVASGNAAITLTAGSHTIGAPLVLNDSTVATVAGGQTLLVNGPLTLNAGVGFSATGGGTVRLVPTTVTASAGASVHANGATLQVDNDLGTNVAVAADAGEVQLRSNQHIASLSVAAGAKASVVDVSGGTRIVRTRSLSLDASGTLQLGSNALVLDYSGTSSPAAAVRTAIAAGKTGNEVGTGLISSRAAADSKYTIGYAEASAIGSPTTFLGETGIDGTTVLVRTTLAGDTNLDGNVGFNDLLALAKNYNGTNKVWTDGDLDYNGTVEFADLLALAKNYNGTVTAAQSSQLGASFAGDLALAQSLVPEPTTLGLAFAAMAMGVSRRRR